MKIKINNLDDLNDILFYAGFGVARDSLVCVMNQTTLETLTINFIKEHKDIEKKYPHIEDPLWFAENNGVHFAIGNWLKNGEVDIKL